MSYQPWDALAGGAAGVAAMTLLMRAAVASGMTYLQMPLILGGMVTRDPARARLLGLMAHVVNGLVFGLAYGAIWWWWDLGGQNLATGVWVGAAIAVAHGLAAVMMMPVMGRLHRRAVEPYPAPELARMRSKALVGAGAPAPAAGVEERGAVEEVRLPARFGLGGAGFGTSTPLGLMMAHLVFGAVWGVVFAALV